MNKKALYPALVLLIGVAVAVLMVITAPAPVGEDYAAPPTTVRTVSVSRQAEFLYVRSQGIVQPRTESQLIPEVSGRVNWTSPSLVAGGAFEAGDVLLRIDDADYRNAVEKGRAVVTRAGIEREHAEDELERLQTLRKQNLASQSDLDEVERRFEVAQASSTEAHISLEQAERDLSRTEIIAPFKGLVRNENVDLGQFIGRGNVIGTIYATDAVEIRLPIASNQLAYLDVSITGQIPTDPAAPVTVSGEYGNVKYFWTGSLVRAEAEIDARSGMLYGVARILNNVDGQDSPPLLVGLFVQATIQGRLVQDVVRLPRSAMRDANQVLVVDAEGRLHFREVDVLRIEHDDVLVRGGLSNGERVCVSPLQTVVEGMRVQAIEA